MKKFSKFKQNHKIIFALLIGFGVVSFWRGAWGMMDVYIFPENYAVSSFISLLLGLSLLGATNYTVKELM